MLGSQMYKINNAEVGSAVSIRPSATALFTVSSIDRFGGIDIRRSADLSVSSPYDFTIRKQESLLNGFFTRMGVSEISFPLTLPNVAGSTAKITVLYNTGAGAVASTLTYFGFYTPSEIAAALQVDIRALDASLAAALVTYGGNGAPNFRFQSASATTLAFAPIGQSSTFNYPANQIQLYDMLGLNSGIVGGTDFIGTSTFFQKYQYLDIVSTLMTGNQNLKDSTSSPVDRNILCRLYVDYENTYVVPADDPAFAPPGTVPFIIYRKYPVPKYVQWDVKQPIGQLNFQVYAPDGVLVENSALYGSSDWKMSVLVSEQ
jgi:hypothetical protein